MAQKIIYTETDEAPALATYSFLPIVKKFTKAAGVEVETRDISLAARILANLSEFIPENKIVKDTLAELGELATKPEANIIKLPNISASMPQLLAAIEELQQQGFSLPDYPEHPNSNEEKKIKAAYDKTKGSAVNPVLREGNSDRRAPKAVKEFAKRNPHSMGEWSSDSKSHVATMGKDDFASNEKSITLSDKTKVSIELHAKSGEVTTLKQPFEVLKGEIIDVTFLSKTALISFLKKEKQDAKEQGVLFSLHMKATMMKVSDPIIFGHAVTVFFKEVFEKHAAVFEKIDVNPNDGLASLFSQLEELPTEQRDQIRKDFKDCLAEGPGMAKVDSDLGITNLHVPSDVIIDASMPAMIRNSGKMWNKYGEAQDTKAVIPDSSYASVYEETIEFCKKNGAFDPKTMGTVPNVGLMAQKAEEYGSHDKTFEIAQTGTVKVVDASGTVLMEHKVEQGDIWRMCQVKDAPIENWVSLAVGRAKATQWPTVFWLDEKRAHDSEVIKKVNKYLKNHDTAGLNLMIKSPAEATRFTLERLKKGENTISVTGNVLRDYLTDLFPILELGTSAKMLSIVPLMNGGGLFETGAGGSAPKHVQQFVEENHLRWDSLGEFLALAVSLEHLADKNQNKQAAILGNCLDQATEKFLIEGKSPSRKVNELDNRGSHYFLAKYWAEALANQSQDQDLRSQFSNLLDKFEQNETKILEELIEVQGKKVDLGGYYYPDKSLVSKAMRPSQTLNEILN